MTCPDLQCVVESREAALFGQSAVVFVAVVGERVDGYASTGGEYPFHFYVARVHKLYEVFHYDVYAVFVEVTVVTEREKVEFQALALHHILARDILDYDAGEVGLPCLRTKGGELRAIERHHIFVFGMLVLECLEHFGGVSVGVFGALVAQECHSVEFLFGSAHRRSGFQ